MEREQDRRVILSALLSFTDQAVYPLALEEVGEELPAGMGEALIAGDAMLPGYITRTIDGPRDDSDRLELLADLRAERVLDNPEIRDWFLAHQDRYPAFASYVVHLECVRQFALDILSESTGAT